MPLRITAIIVARNSERYLEAALQSIFAQTLLPAEILVVDGQSTDRTREIAQGFAGVTVLGQATLGLANARNVGIAHATGDVLAFLDSDDQWHATKLERQLAVLTAHPDIQYCLTHLRLMDAAGLLQRVIAAATPSVLMARRQLFAHIGGFDAQYKIGCDADWFTRARDGNVPTYTLPETLVDKRIHDTNLSHNGTLNRREMAQIAARSIARNRQPHGAHTPHS